ncbi:MAG: hypothetical protein B6I22_06360 [Desulfobacteraceae bacterium 4572_123]|nr:MAG: hypothetical protein B6I22_06360 [Desulfobacteraceae bacterium 4572_123]
MNYKNATFAGTGNYIINSMSTMAPAPVSDQTLRACRLHAGGHRQVMTKNGCRDGQDLSRHNL